MMKRLLRIGVFISFIFCGFRATAQETQVVEAYRYYPNYSFWSNWSIGLNGGMTLNLDRSVTYSTIEPSYGLNLFLSKELNYIWDLRLQGTFHKVNNGLGRGLSMGVGFTFSIFDAIKIGIGFVIGGVLGALLLKKISNIWLEIVFSVIIIAGGIKMLI